MNLPQRVFELYFLSLLREPADAGESLRVLLLWPRPLP